MIEWNYVRCMGYSFELTKEWRISNKFNIGHDTYKMMFMNSSSK